MSILIRRVVVQPSPKQVQVPSSSLTRLLDSWSSWSCAPSARWPLGFHSHLDSPVTLQGSVTLRWVSALVIRELPAPPSASPPHKLTLEFSYWFKYIIVTPNQLTAAALVLQYWVPREKVNPGVFIAVFLVLIVCINYFGVRFFGELEFWLSSIKVVVIVALIILSLVLALGGGPDHDRKGFRYWYAVTWAPLLSRSGRLGSVLPCTLGKNPAHSPHISNVRPINPHPAESSANRSHSG